MPMQIKLKEITVRELTNGYKDNNEKGVSGFGGKLDIRPPYQREFIYGDEERKAVIHTLTKDFPLNVMYWVVRDNNDVPFEVLDGQQRTISICQYVNGDFSYEKNFFENLQDEEKNQILNYKLTVYECIGGGGREKLDWFKIINIAGKELNHQELLNATYAGSWVSDAKLDFSRTNCRAHGIGEDYLKGSPKRQDYLKTAIKWINNGKIEEYMATHQHDQNAKPLWRYFEDVIAWVEATFKTKRKFMKGVDWGTLYNQFKDNKYDAEAIEEEVVELLLDDDVEKKNGIYKYILTRDENCLSFRAFPDNVKYAVYERQNGICKKCKKHFKSSEMEADHITPWSKGGKTIKRNCQMLCKECNRRKSAK